MKICGTIHLVDLGEADCWELRADNGKTYVIRGASPDFKEGLRVECTFNHIDKVSSSYLGKRHVAIMDSYKVIE